jgi:ADP-ribose pyrophosphatase
VTADDGAAAAPTGGWSTHGRRVRYTSPWMALELLDVATPDGRRYEHHVARLPASSSALVLDEHDRVLLMWKYRVVTDRWGHELPGGMVDPGEAPAAAAARECAEETGWCPVGESEQLLSLEPLPGQVVAPCEVHLWHGARPSGAPIDPEETGEVLWVPLDDVLGLVTKGALAGAATLAGLTTLLARRAAGA